MDSPLNATNSHDMRLYNPSDSDHSMDEDPPIQYQENEDDEWQRWIRFIRSPSFMRTCIPILQSNSNFTVNMDPYHREFRDREPSCELKPSRERERETQKPFRIQYKNSSPCCIECGRFQCDGYWNNNEDPEYEEEDLFWCRTCKEQERLRNYKEAEPMRAFCENPECKLQVKVERVQIGNTNSIRMERKHLLLHNNISQLDVCIYTKGKTDSITGEFFCRQCWKDYVNCDDLIAYKYRR